MDSMEDVQAHALKLFEVLLIDYRGQIDPYVPKFMELAVARLSRSHISNELRSMCLQVSYL